MDESWPQMSSLSQWQDKMSMFGGSMNGSTSNLYRSQSMASLGGERPGILGESFRSNYTLMRNNRAAELKDLGLNAKNLAKIPKHPRPKRTKDIFAAVIQGLKESVKAAEEDYEQAKEDSRHKTTGSHSLKVKTIERHKKKLEYLLSKIEELQDQYDVQDQMREGTKAMSKAYEQSLGVHKRNSIASVQYGYKECTKTMCAIEAQLESMLGQFHCQMKGIMGFARVMPGDSFEVSIRHGNQKWKTKGHVSKDNEQRWEVERKTLQIQIQSSLSVKVFESKRLSKSSLGEKHCDILGLFAVHPQILTVNVNDIGTIKLNILIQWQPLANFTEKMSFYDPPPRESVSPRPLSVVLPYQDTLSSTSSTHSLEKRHTSLGLSSPVNRPDLLCDMKEDSSQSLRVLAEAIDEEEREVYNWPDDLETALHRLRDTLEDCPDKNSVLTSIYESLCELSSLIKPTAMKKHKEVEKIKSGASSRRHSSISLAIESAFDFLNCEACDTEDEEEQRDQLSALSPTSTARSTADSGIESLLRRMSDASLSPTPFTTGNDGLDKVLLQHIVLCDMLLESLDTVGKLKSKEKSAMNKLKQQSRIIKRLLDATKKVLANPYDAIDVKQVMTAMAHSCKQAHEFWQSASDSLYMTIPQFSKALDSMYTSQLKEQYDIKLDKVYNYILKRITHGSYYSKENQKHVIVTVYQYLATLLDSKCRSMDYYIQEISAEVWLLSQLKSAVPSVVSRSIKSLRDSLPSYDIIRMLLLLIVSPTSEIGEAADYYFVDLARDSKERKVVLSHVLLCLEDTRNDVRTGACICLDRMKAVEATEELLYVAQSDISKRVQALAKRTLASLSTCKRSSLS